MARILRLGQDSHVCFAMSVYNCSQAAEGYAGFGLGPGERSPEISAQALLVAWTFELCGILRDQDLDLGL